jgi:hypothetical protein
MTIDRRNASLTVEQVSLASAGGEWGIPEFQRDFVWTAQRVGSLTRSLAFGWSMSCWHLWAPRKNREDVRHRNRRVDGDQPEKWVLDGQQRLTSIALITGRRPAWYSASSWTKLLASHGPSLDLRSLMRTGKVVVGLPQVPASWWIPFRLLFTSPKILQAELKERGYADSYALASDVASRIDQYQVPIVTLQNTPAAEVVEQFRLLNQQATRVPPAIVRQGVLSVMVPGFTVDFAEPLREELGLAGWPVKQTTLIDSFLDMAGVKRVEAVDPELVPALQKRCQTAWRKTISYLAEAGVHGLSCWPAERMLRAMVIASDGWAESQNDLRLAQWALCAQWDGHQAIGDLLVQDIATVQSGRKAESAWKDVIGDLCSRLEPSARPVKVGDLADVRTSPTSGANGSRERMLYAIANPTPPELTKNAKVPVWVPLVDGPTGLADWALTLGTTRSSQPTIDALGRGDRARQAVVSPHTTAVRAKALAATMNTALERVGAPVRPKNRHR